MSVFRFKSRETGDLVMLEPHGKRILEIIGKDPSAPGIVQPQQVDAAVQAIRAAVATDETRRQGNHTADAADDEDGAQADDTVSLRMRSAPFIEMLERSQKAGVEVVWGV